MSAFYFKTSKQASVPLRVALVLFVTLCGVYICLICMKQIAPNTGPEDMIFGSKNAQLSCISHSNRSESLYIHFPRPRTFSRDECSCNPVQFFVIVSMQRSGSGWFETLLNSHPNVSSNGEVFNVKERRSNATSIVDTLDIIYHLDWLSSASKNECLGAVGFKWMLNQGLLDYPAEIRDYFNLNKVSIIFLFRRNLLRRLISMLANDYDRHARQLNGTHKSHVHSNEEAEVLAHFKPVIDTSVLFSNLSNAEKTMAESLQLFGSVRHIVVYYEDVFRNNKTLAHIQEFLGVPVRKLESRQVKIHTKPPSELVVNWKDVYNTLNGTKYGNFLLNADYVS